MANVIGSRGFRKGNRLIAIVGTAFMSATILVACGGGDDEKATSVPATVVQAPVETPTVAAAASPMASPSPILVVSPMASPEGSPVASPEGSPAASPVGATVVELKDIVFDPADITVKAGEVTIMLKNTGMAPHSFVIDTPELKVNSGELAPGEEKEVTFQAAAGTYEFICDVPGHKEAGMVGVMTVE